MATARKPIEKVNIKAYAQAVVRADAKVRRDITKALTKDAKSQVRAATADSFVNFAQKMGVGADNALTTAGYGFNPITRNRVGLEWVHRGSWLGGIAVDAIPEDMTRAGVDLLGVVKPHDITKMDSAASSLGIWTSVKEVLQWSRLYGGAVAFLMIDGQKPETPLRIETVGKGMFKGLFVFDRWMIDATMNELVTDLGPDVGLPKYYKVFSDAPAFRGAKIHYSRIIRQVGIKLPFNQAIQENLWGISVLERLYDRMIAFDSATTGAAQMVYKSFIRTYKIKGMRAIATAGGQALKGLTTYTDMMRRFQGIEGMTLMDLDDEYEGHEAGSSTGIPDTLRELGQQIAGALQMPLVRLFGQSPAGFGSGDTDLRMYYDSIKQKQNQGLREGVTKTYRCIGQSEGIKLGDDFGIEFRSLWQLLEKEKAEISSALVDAVTKAQEAGLVSDQVAMKELKQNSRVTGIFSNISEKDINAADDTAQAPPLAEEIGEIGANGLESGKALKAEEAEAKPAVTAKAPKPKAPSK